MSFDYLMGYIISISMCMQNFIIIFHSVQDKGPFSLFQNLELGKPRPMKNVISQSLGLDFVNINVYANVYQNIPLSSRNRAIFTFSVFGARQSLKVNDKCHFAISWTRCHQYQCVCKILLKYSNGLELLTFFTNRPGTKSSQTVRWQNQFIWLWKTTFSFSWLS